LIDLIVFFNQQLRIMPLVDTSRYRP